MSLIIVIGPEDKSRIQAAERHLTPRLDYRLVAECFPNTTIQEWHPSPPLLNGIKPSRVARSFSGNLRRALALVRGLPRDSVIYATGETWGIPIALALAVSGAPNFHITYVHRVFAPDWLVLLRGLRPLLRIDGWICVTQHQRAVLARTLGSHGAPITAITQGVDPVFYDSALPVATKRTPYLLTVGAEMRDYNLLFDAVAPLDVPVIVRPSSSWLPRPRYNIRSIPSNVSLITRHLSYIELRDLYAGALAVAVPLLPTLQAAGITTTLEAMVMGKCVVATKSKGLPDILSNGVTGMVVEHNAGALRGALARCVADAAWRDTLGNAGRCMARERASLEYHASQVAAFIRQVAGA